MHTEMPTIFLNLKQTHFQIGNTAFMGGGGGEANFYWRN